MAQGEGENFSFSTIENFDQHIAREIRGYELLDPIVRGIAEASIEDDTNVYDIGCSTGRLLNAIATSLNNETDPARRKQVNLIGIEPNASMVSQFKPASDNVTIRHEKVDEDTQFTDASLVTSIFTLQFLPVKQRPQILRNIHEGLNPNGTFIWAEKVHTTDGRIESLINAEHLAFKQEGSSAEDILHKDSRLKSIMRPLDLSTNERMLEDVGFERHEVFWRVNNFLALIAIKSY